MAKTRFDRHTGQEIEIVNINCEFYTKLMNLFIMISDQDPFAICGMVL